MYDIIKYWDEQIVESHTNTVEVVKFFNNQNKKNINYIDIGANVGKVFDELNDAIGVNKCYLVEPSKELADYMRRKYSDLNNVKVIEKGLTKENKMYEFLNNNLSHYQMIGKQPSLNLGLSSITGKDNVSGDNYLIEGITGSKLLEEIDLIPSELDYIKIDTENCDFFVLESIYSYLKENNIHPYISFEVNYNQFMSIEDAKSILQPYFDILNYKFIDLNTNEESDLNLIPS